MLGKLAAVMALTIGLTGVATAAPTTDQPTAFGLPPGNDPVPHQTRIGKPVADKAAAATLKVSVIDKYGKPSSDIAGHAINLGTGDGDFLRSDGSGAATAELEPGTYDISVLSITTDAGGAREFTAVTTRSVTVTAEGGAATVDARGAKPVTAKVDRPGAKVVDSTVSVATKVGGSGFVNTYFTGPNGKVFTVPNKPVDGRQQLFVYRPTLGGTTPDGKPFRYNLVHVDDRALPDAPVYHTPDNRLARFDTTYYAQGKAAESSIEGNNGRPAALPDLAIFRYVPVAMPSERIEYYTAGPGVTWLNLRILAGEEAAYTSGSHQAGVTRTTWFRTPVGASWGDPATFAGITRTGDELVLEIQPFAPSDGRRYQGALGSGDEGKTTLSLNGKEIATAETVGSANFTLPSEKGRYTLRTSGMRNAPYSNLDTTVISEWTFDSATTKEATRLPVSLIRLGTNGQNSLGQVKAGSNHELTLKADPQPGAKRTGIPKLEISHDDGQTWRRVPVGWGYQQGNSWVTEPRTAGFVSLRVTATNSDGARFTQTLIRAYELV